MKKEMIGVDIGGTNVRVARLNEDLEILAKQTVSTGDFHSREAFFGKICEMIRAVDLKRAATKVGFVFPAPWRDGNTVIDDVTNIPFLDGMEVEAIRALLPEYQLYFENDVNVIALLEADRGAAKGTGHSIYITVSTGIGSGIIVDGKIYHGANGYAGEIGSILLSKCVNGTLEEMCSGKALDQKSRSIYGEEATAARLFMDCEKGEKRAEEELALWMEELTRGVASVVQVIDPEVIVLGGPVVLKNAFVTQQLRENVPKKVMRELAGKVRIEQAMFGGEAGIIGAGYFALQQGKIQKEEQKR